jgi:hypothetical protein
MKRTLNLLLACAFSVALLLPAVYAEDGTNAQCHVREKGEHKKKKSGACTITEKQGVLWILLANGESFTLKPGKKKEHFRDQRDKVVKRHYEAGNPVYKWEKRTITVNPDNA